MFGSLGAQGMAIIADVDRRWGGNQRWPPSSSTWWESLRTRMYKCTAVSPASARSPATMWNIDRFRTVQMWNIYRIGSCPYSSKLLAQQMKTTWLNKKDHKDQMQRHPVVEETGALPGSYPLVIWHSYWSHGPAETMSMPINSMVIFQFVIQFVMWTLPGRVDVFHRWAPVWTPRAWKSTSGDQLCEGADHSTSNHSHGSFEPRVEGLADGWGIDAFEAMRRQLKPKP